MIEIIFFAALAGFILFKLLQTLGKYEDEEQDETKSNSLKELRNVISQIKQMEENHTKQPFGQYAATLSDSFKKTIMQIQKKDPSFHIEKFIEQAKKAFVMAIRALNRSEVDILQQLLDDKIYQQFLKEIERRKAIEQTYSSSIARYDSITVENISFKKDIASITLRFVTEQAILVRNKEGIISEVKRDELSTIEDVWTFERNFKQDGKHWLITSTTA